MRIVIDRLIGQPCGSTLAEEAWSPLHAGVGSGELPAFLPLPVSPRLVLLLPLPLPALVLPLLLLVLVLVLRPDVLSCPSNQHNAPLADGITGLCDMRGI